MPHKWHCVLLVDDDVISHFITRKVLEESGLVEHTRLLYTGQEALKYVRKHCSIAQDTYCPDLILLDLRMPGMDGFEFVEELDRQGLRKTYGIKVVLLTSSESRKDRERAEALQVDGFISKPITPDKLLHQVSA